MHASEKYNAYNCITCIEVFDYVKKLILTLPTHYWKENFTLKTRILFLLVDAWVFWKLFAGKMYRQWCNIFKFIAVIHNILVVIRDVLYHWLWSCGNWCGVENWNPTKPNKVKNFSKKKKISKNQPPSSKISEISFSRQGP